MRTILTPASRLHDPEPSYAAEHHINQGSRQRQIEKVADLVKLYPGSTSRELASKGELSNEVLHKRLPDAVTAGPVKKGTWRQCFVTGRKATTWWPQDYGV